LRADILADGVKGELPYDVCRGEVPIFVCVTRCEGVSIVASFLMGVIAFSGSLFSLLLKSSGFFFSNCRTCSSCLRSGKKLYCHFKIPPSINKVGYYYYSQLLIIIN
jgi:hypothetical protein